MTVPTKLPMSSDIKNSLNNDLLNKTSIGQQDEADTRGEKEAHKVSFAPKKSQTQFLDGDGSAMASRNSL